MTARATYGWYLEKTSGAEENLEIQRGIISTRKTYETLRADLARGCVLPPIVLSIKDINLPPNLRVSPFREVKRLEDSELRSLGRDIESSGSHTVQIIDGLQRTNAIRQVAEGLFGEERETFLRRPIRLEFWLNIPFYALAYRMLLLNAGQKPMSMKHQIEIISENMKGELKKIDGLEVKTGLDKKRRVRPGQFQLSLLAGAFQAWIQKQPNIDIRTALTEQLLSDEAVQTLGAGLSPSGHEAGERFDEFVGWLVKLDYALGQDHISILGSETVILALSAAVASSSSKPDLKHRCDRALERIITEIRRNGAEEGFAPSLYYQIRNQIDTKKKNVGEASRDLVYRAFSEYIVSDGIKSMKECWTFASTYI